MDFLVKLLKTNNVDIVKYSQDQFGFKLPSELTPNRTAEFIIAKLQASEVQTLFKSSQIVLKYVIN